MYQAQEQLHKATAGARSGGRRRSAKARRRRHQAGQSGNWPADVESGQGRLASDSEALANQIAETILRRNAA